MRKIDNKSNMAGKIFDLFNMALLTIFCISILYPFLKIITFSLSSDADIMKEGLHIFPQNIYLTNWIVLLHDNVIWTSLFNTVFVTLTAWLYSMFISSTYAYALSRRNLPDRKLWTIILLVTMYFSGGLVPTYLLYKDLGLTNSLWALVFSGISAWNVLIIRNFFMTVPESIPESARIDGASEISIYYKIMLPLSLPVLATVSLWVIVSNWNSWVPCLIYITDPKKHVLQIILRRIIIENEPAVGTMEQAQQMQKVLEITKGKPPSTEGLKAAVLIFVTLPILITYPFLQKYFVKGVLVGSLKG